LSRRDTRIWLVWLLLPLSASAQDFKVTLLGTGSPIPSESRFGPATLVEAGTEKLLIDCGRGASIRLWQRQVSLSALTAVFLTHLHSDHVNGLPDLWLTGWLPPPFGHRTKPFSIWGPAGTREMMSHLEKAFQADIRIRMADEKLPARGIGVVAKDIVQGVVYENNGVKVTAFDVNHGDEIKPAYGYRIDYKGHAIVLSGDTRVSENLIRFAQGADVLIHEVALAKPEVLQRSEAARRIAGHHTSPEEAGAVFTRVKPRLAVYSHIVLFTTEPEIGEPGVADVVTLTRRTYQGPLEIGEDLTSIDIGAEIQIHRYAPAGR
jgi:ribonuclease Z